jgi:hypothetical protein
VRLKNLDALDRMRIARGVAQRVDEAVAAQASSNARAADE